MSERDELRDLVGHDVSAEELEELRRVDALLRSVPPPPHVPESLTHAVRRVGGSDRPWTRRRLAAGLALAAALGALFFGIGRWTDGGTEPEYVGEVKMRATENAPGASALIKLGKRDEASGNWEIELEVSGLRKLPPGRYYVLWLAKDGEYAATCGTFNVGRAGTTTVEMTASYSLKNYDGWVISEHGDDTPWLLRARVDI